MIKTFRFLGPFIVLIAIIINFVAAWYHGNDEAMWANITAFTGWLVVALDGYFAQMYVD